MKPQERPILFKGEMVRAILDSRKTETRRIVKFKHGYQPEEFERMQTYEDGFYRAIFWGYGESFSVKSPYGGPGDRLWTKETFLIDDYRYDSGPLPKAKPPDLLDYCIYFRADGECCEQIPECQCEGHTNWRPSIFMPRWASRMTNEITSIHVERLQDITPLDAIYEGAYEIPNTPEYMAEFDAAVKAGLKPPIGMGPRERYKILWESTHGKGSWDKNPWVWVIKFKPVTQ